MNKQTNVIQPLRNDFMRDLIADIRFCNKCISKNVNTEENTTYKNKLLLDLKALLAKRHIFKLNCYGYPVDANN